MPRPAYNDGRISTVAGIRTTPEALRRLRRLAERRNTSLAISLGRILEEAVLTDDEVRDTTPSP